MKYLIGDYEHDDGRSIALKYRGWINQWHINNFMNSNVPCKYCTFCKHLMKNIMEDTVTSLTALV